MKTSIKKFIYITGFLAVIFAVGCTDEIVPEITKTDLNRLLSPTGIDARVVNKTSVRLTWRSVKDAQSYTIEIFENGTLDFTGTPVKTVAVVSFDQLPITIAGFAGETSYSVRVKAVGESISESKWVSSTFTTDTEQIFYPVDPLDITATGVTLKWPAGEVATSIILTPGDITHAVTAGEIAAGVAEISALEDETVYTARLMNGTKIRGTVTFKTLLDLGGATPVYPEDDLNAAITAAQAGDVLVLFPGRFTVYTGDIAINKSITIKGFYPHNKPVVYNRFVFSAGVTDVIFADLEMDGTIDDIAPKTVQAFFFDPGTYEINTISVTGCIIHDYNQALIYGGSAIVKVQTITINNCIVSDIINDGGDFIDFRTGHVVNLNITNSTFNRVAAAPRDFIRLDNSSGNFGGTGVSTSNILIDRCTFYQVSNARRILYVRYLNNASTVSNTIFAGADASYTGYYTNQAGTTQPVCSGNNYFNAPRFLSGVTNGKYDISGTHTTLDPGFVNAAAGDFKLTNLDLILNGTGDPRWLQ